MAISPERLENVNSVFEVTLFDLKPRTGRVEKGSGECMEFSSSLRLWHQWGVVKTEKKRAVAVAPEKPLVTGPEATEGSATRSQPRPTQRRGELPPSNISGGSGWPARP